jgi:hypothetical protein
VDNVGHTSGIFYRKLYNGENFSTIWQNKAHYNKGEIYQHEMVQCRAASFVTVKWSSISWCGPYNVWRDDFSLSCESLYFRIPQAFLSLPHSWTFARKFMMKPDWYATSTTNEMTSNFQLQASLTISVYLVNPCVGNLQRRIHVECTETGVSY